MGKGHGRVSIPLVIGDEKLQRAIFGRVPRSSVNMSSAKYLVVTPLANGFEIPECLNGRDPVF